MKSFLANAIETDDKKAIIDATSEGIKHYIITINRAIGSIDEIDTPLLLVALEITKQNIIRINPLAGELAETLMKFCDIPITAIRNTTQPEE